MDPLIEAVIRIASKRERQTLNYFLMLKNASNRQGAPSRLFRMEHLLPNNINDVDTSMELFNSLQNDREVCRRFRKLKRWALDRAGPRPLPDDALGLQVFHEIAARALIDRACRGVKRLLKMWR